MTTSSWGHTVRELTEEELERIELRRLHNRIEWSDHAACQQNGRVCRICGELCRMGKCAEQPTHEITYRYVTGRAGRVSWAAKKVCTSHAETFREKYAAEVITPINAEQDALVRVEREESAQ